jgi:hypothetical protein
MRKMSIGYYDGNDEPEAEDMISLKDEIRTERMHFGLFFPNTPITDQWDKLMLVLLLYTAIVTPVEVAFSNKVKYDGLFVVNRLVDFCFLLDMGMNFNQAYPNAEDGRMVTNRRRIARHYMMGWFSIDVISIIPFDLLGGGPDPDPNSTAPSSNLKIFRVIRLLRLIKLMKLVKAATVFGRIKSKLGTSHSTMELCKYLIWLFMLMHWSACAWRIVPKLEGAAVNWLTEAKRKDADMHLSGETEGWRNWDDGFTVYGMCLLVAIQQLSFAPDGVMYPVTNAEVFYSAFSMIFSGSIFVYLVGAVCALLANMNPALVEYNQTLDNLNRYLNNIDMPYSKTREMRDYFLHCKDMFQSKWYQQMLSHLSPALQVDVANHCYRGALESIWFFKVDKPEEEDGFFNQVTLLLESRVYCPEEYLFERGQRAKHLFIIIKGLILTKGRVLHAGAVLGEDMILLQGHRMQDALCMTYVDVNALSQDSLNEAFAMGEFSTIYRKMRKAVGRLCVRRSCLKIWKQKNAEKSGMSKAESAHYKVSD